MLILLQNFLARQRLKMGWKYIPRNVKFLVMPNLKRRICQQGSPAGVGREGRRGGYLHASSCVVTPESIMLSARFRKSTRLYFAR
jgi:hypothetical protein